MAACERCPWQRVWRLYCILGYDTVYSSTVRRRFGGNVTLIMNAAYFAATSPYTYSVRFSRHRKSQGWQRALQCCSRKHKSNYTTRTVLRRTWEISISCCTLSITLNKICLPWIQLKGTSTDTNPETVTRTQNAPKTSLCRQLLARQSCTWNVHILIESR